MHIFIMGKPWICIKQIVGSFHESFSMYDAGTFSAILGKVMHIISA
jgi:hypothetical protein